MHVRSGLLLLLMILAACLVTLAGPTATLTGRVTDTTAGPGRPAARRQLHIPRGERSAPGVPEPDLAGTHAAGCNRACWQCSVSNPGQWRGDAIRCEWRANARK